MCGICGIFDFKGRPVERSLIARMTETLHHRGPDGEGVHLSGPIGMGHRRLSIIDIDGGSQPIANEDGSLLVVFNGEIYNFIELRDELKKKGHNFRTRSDTEVILHAYEEWGQDCVQQFNGIFAFALWDENRKKLVLARDHLGVKPLYYVRTADRLLFASEIKALLTYPECPREVDIRSLGQLFTLRYVPSPDTLFREIHKLPPAHWMTVSAEGLQIQRFWNWTPHIKRHVDEAAATEAYQDLVENSIRLQMRSDVPVGLFLSSGVDSGALLSLMSRLSGYPVRTFTIGFEDGEKSSETVDARNLAQRYGANHTELVVTPRDYEKYYERYLWDLEEPVGNETAAAFYFVSWLASKQVKVALTGQGADEPWAGYHRYIGITLSEVYSRLPHLVTDRFFRPLVEHLSRNERLLRGVASLSEPDVLMRCVKVYSFFTQAMKAQLFQPWMLDQISTDGVEARDGLERIQGDVRRLDPLSQMLYIDTRANLPDDLLMVADKTGMANSIEVRVPFLDRRLIEFVETLPPRLKLKGFTGKYLHKKTAERWLPKSVVYRKKKGFENPIDHWLRDQMRNYVGDCLLSESAKSRRYFRAEYVRRLIREHETGNQNHLRHIYLLVSFELWHRQFISS